ncbi:barstar family protein [Streptomyces microflavus]
MPRDESSEITDQCPDRRSVFRLNGVVMESTQGLFGEFAEKMQFPSYFGRNWAALEDCLYDMTWSPSPGGYLVVIEEWPAVLRGSKENIPVFLDILNDVGSSWAQYPGAGIPFNTVLVGKPVESDH